VGGALAVRKGAATQGATGKGRARWEKEQPLSLGP
jgi:hypothetical protein